MTTAAGRMSAAPTPTTVEGGRRSLRSHTGETVIALNAGVASILNASESAVVIVAGLEGTTLRRRCATRSVLLGTRFVAATEGVSSVETLSRAVEAFAAAAEVLTAKALCDTAVGIGYA